MRALSVVFVACVLYAQAGAAHADILRCGSSLIEVGDTVGHVLQKCGTPASKTIVEEPVWSRGVNGNVYQTGTTKAELWRYTFGPNKFPAVVRITEGVVESIEFEKTRG